MVLLQHSRHLAMYSLRSSKLLVENDAAHLGLAVDALMVACPASESPRDLLGRFELF